MENERWIGSRPWERASDKIDGHPSRIERNVSNTRDIDDLIQWLEYGKTSGYIAARQPKDQEEYWAQLVKNLLMEKDVIEHLIFFTDNVFEFTCKECETICKGYVSKGNTIYDSLDINIEEKCECITKRQSDVENYIVHYFINEFGYL